MTSPTARSLTQNFNIGDSIILWAMSFPHDGCSPRRIRFPSASLYLYVEDADSLFNQAVSAGCESTMPVTTMFWGPPYGKVVDPFGHHWGIAHAR